MQIRHKKASHPRLADADGMHKYSVLKAFERPVRRTAIQAFQ